ncbi:MAG: hypothetical protein ACC642_04960, partial [Pseudomonadales bacterium]
IVPVFHFITERAQQAFRGLVPILGSESAQLTTWEARISRKPRTWNSLVLMLGLSAGLVHNWLLWPPLDFVVLLGYPFGLMSILSTMLVWVSMTTVIAALLDNARLFNRLAKQAEINVLNPKSLTPFASVAVSSTLAIIGAQAAFPALIYGSDMNQLAFVPGLIATGIPMLLMFFLPIWPVHQRLIEAKRAELESVSAEINRLPHPRENEPRNYQSLNPLLIYRREITQMSEWPFDTSVMGRLALYLIIPPLTWVGAALIENLVDAAI